MKFTFYYIEPNTKSVIALAVFIHLQESMSAKVVYLDKDIKKK